MNCQAKAGFSEIRPSDLPKESLTMVHRSDIFVAGAVSNRQSDSSMNHLQSRDAPSGAVSSVVAPVGPLKALFLLVIATLLLSSVAPASERPNIVFILTDDVGIGDLRSYNADGKIALPTIDRLASEGVRFTDAHTTAAKCAPSRYSIITGNYHWRGRKSWGQWDYKGGSQILPGQKTLGDLLQHAGYRTAIIGKYHLGAEFYLKNSNKLAAGNDSDSVVDFSRPMMDGPAEHGFDRSFIALRGIQAAPYAFFSDGLLVGVADDLIIWQSGDYGDTDIGRNGVGLPDWNTRLVGPVLLEQAIEFIETHSTEHMAGERRAPFFLYLNTQAVHSPYKPPISIGGRRVLGGSGLTDRTDMLVEIDVILDQIIRTLDRHSLLDDTLIIFTSDNGGISKRYEERKGHFVSGNLRGDKGTIYEGGHRVPLIIKWGRKAFETSSLPPGSAIDALVGIHDLYATIADLIGVSMSAGEGLDSLSFLPILTGRQSTSPRRTMVHEADAPERYGSGPKVRHFAYRSGRFKLVFDNAQSPVELYDLEADPSESTNLIARQQFTNRVALMREEFDAVLLSERTAPLSGSNEQPIVTIDEPLDGSSFSFEQTVHFRASASDVEDGALDESIVWTSDIDGNLGNGSLVSASAMTPAEHRVTATVTDSAGSTASSSIVVVITEVTSNQSPIVSITTPADGISVPVGARVEFSATASDPEDGSIDSSIEWTSSIDGILSTGASIAISDLSVGIHTITASATDSAGATGSAMISVTVSDSTPSVPDDSPSDASGSGGGSLGLLDLLWLASSVLLLARWRRLLRSNVLAALGF